MNELNKEEIISDDECLYTVDDKYLHVQSADCGFDYTLYDRNTGKDIDGGVIETDVCSLADAAAEICVLHGLGSKDPLCIVRQSSILNEFCDI